MMIIFDRDAEDAERQTILDGFEKGVNEMGGSITFTDSWGMRPFAYEINHKNEGFYVVIEFQMQGDLSELERPMRLSESVVRQKIMLITTEEIQRRNSAGREFDHRNIGESRESVESNKIGSTKSSSKTATATMTSESDGDEPEEEAEESIDDTEIEAPVEAIPTESPEEEAEESIDDTEIEAPVEAIPTESPEEEAEESTDDTEIEAPVEAIPTESPEETISDSSEENPEELGEIK